MPRFVKRRSEKVGLRPGSLVHVGDEKPSEARITVIDYDREQLHESEIRKVEECLTFRDKPTVTWINVDGVNDAQILEKIGECFGLHPLILEDIMNTDQRPKVEDFGNYMYVVLKMLHYDNEKSDVVTEQVSIILGSGFVISFQEREGDVFNPIRDRVRTARGLIRKMGPDYLTYALIDAIVDNYFLILERLGEKIEYIEDELVTKPTLETLREIHELKRDMIFLRKSVWPLREVVSKLEREGSKLIKETTGISLRDVYDHTVQVIDAVETFRDMLSGMLDIYLSSISNRMNEVMKVLTIIATIFIPLTLISGVYGMNFAYMPELGSPWGYPLVLLSMAIIVSLMLVYFRRKRWL